jgi:anti-sigma B factor antagonist
VTMPELQTVTIQPHAEVLWAVVREARLDDQITKRLQDEVPTAAAQVPGKPVVLDFAKVEFIPSLGLGALVGLLRRLKQDGHRLLLVEICPTVRSTFTITRLDKLFEIYPTVEAALKHLQGKG